MQHLSERAERYLQKISKGVPRPSEDDVKQGLNALQLPPIPCFSEALILLEGLTLKTPIDTIYWHRLPRPGEANDKYLEDLLSIWSHQTKDGLWLNVCSSKYPGHIYLWERGAIHFEADPLSPWYSSVYAMIEEHACITEVVGETADAEIRGTIRCSSRKMLPSMLKMELDHDASDRTLTFTSGNGVCVIFSPERIESAGICGAALFGSEEFIDEIVYRLRDNLQVVIPMDYQKGVFKKAANRLRMTARSWERFWRTS